MFKIQTKSMVRHGVSMFEIVISTLVVGVMLVWALQSVGAVYRTQRINAARLSAPGLAQELIAEIISKPYEDPEGEGTGNGAESGESTTTRADFDDVDDYHGWDSASATDADGVAATDYTGWRREIDVAWADLLSGTYWPLETGLKRIKVRITDPSGKQTDYYALRWKDGVLEQQSAVNRTVVSFVGAELQLGTKAKPAHAGTNLSNQAVDAP